MAALGMTTTLEQVAFIHFSGHSNQLDMLGRGEITQAESMKPVMPRATTANNFLMTVMAKD